MKKKIRKMILMLAVMLVGFIAVAGVPRFKVNKGAAYGIAILDFESKRQVDGVKAYVSYAGDGKGTYEMYPGNSHENFEFCFFDPGVYHVWFHHYEYGDCYADFHVGEEESEEGGVTILASLFLAK